MAKWRMQLWVHLRMLSRSKSTPFSAAVQVLCRESVELRILTGDGGEGSTTIGRLANMWAGFNAKGLCSKADNYTVEYPKQLLVGHKMALLGSAILDYMFFESRETKNDESGYRYGAPAEAAMIR